MNTDTSSAALQAALQALRAELVLYLYKRTRDWSVAEDLSQASLLRAWERRASLSDADKLRPWLYTIARRALYDRSRRAPPEQLGAEAELSDAQLEGLYAESVAAVADEDHGCACALSLTNTLSPGQAELIRLVDVEERSLADAAERVATTKNAATVRLFRARQNLKDKLREHCGVTDARSASRCSCDSTSCAPTRESAMTQL